MEEPERYEFKCDIDWHDDLPAIVRHFELSGDDDIRGLEGEIRFDYRKPSPVEIVLFYESENLLYEKLHYLYIKGKNILNYIKVPCTRPEKASVGYLDFGRSVFIDLSESPGKWRAGKKPVVIRLRNLTCYLTRKPEADGIFFLSENVCIPPDPYTRHQHKGYLLFNERFADNGTPEEMFEWGEMGFGLSYKYFLNETGKSDIHIVRLPALTVRAPGWKTDEEIRDYGHLICLMMSLFWNKFIDFYLARIRINPNDEKTKPEIKERIEFSYTEIQPGDLLYDTCGSNGNTFFHFLESVPYPKVLECRELLEDITSRIVKSRYADPTSEFMLLYNVIEKIRNFHIRKAEEKGEPFIVEEFSFILSKRKSNLFIQKKLQEIAEIVQEKDKELYLEKTLQKVSFIRKTGLKDQFDSLLSYLGLSPADYKTDLISLVYIRNQIYHGNFIETDLEPSIRIMRKLINDLLLRTLNL